MKKITLLLIGFLLPLSMMSQGWTENFESMTVDGFGSVVWPEGWVALNGPFDMVREIKEIMQLKKRPGKVIENISQFQENKSSSRGAFINNPYQMVERDFAFLFSREIEANEIIKKVKKVNKNLIKKVTIFDVYDGDKLPVNKKSIAFRVLMQPQDKTFSEQEIENLCKQIIDVISKSFEASIRN